VITRLAIFDFDGTLFRSPQPPEWWERGGAWWRDVKSLHPPCVPPKPDAGWWNKNITAAAKKSASDPKTLTVLLTGRWAQEFEPRVRELVKQQGLRFDKVLLPASPGALAFKMGTLRQLLDTFPGIQMVDVYDDHAEHARSFQTLFSKHGVKVRINNVVYRPHEPACPTPLEHLIREARQSLLW